MKISRKNALLRQIREKETALSRNPGEKSVPFHFFTASRSLASVSLSNAFRRSLFAQIFTQNFMFFFMPFFVFLSRLFARPRTVSLPVSLPAFFIVFPCGVFLFGHFSCRNELLAQEFPYQAAVCEAEVFVRSGPGSDFYPTDKLQNGDLVQVFKHTPDGWCAIRPPVGSFSYVSSRYVQMAQSDLGRIVGNAVPVYVGSRLSPTRSNVQVTLTAGKVVEVLELPTESLESLCKISPPAGEFRWIHGKSLSPNRTGITEEPTPPNRTIGLESPTPEGTLSPSSPGTSEPEQIEPGSFMHYVNQIDADLSYIIAGSSSDKWETQALLMRANRLMNYAKTTAERDRLEHVRQKIIEADYVRQNRLEFQRILSTANENGVTPSLPANSAGSKPQLGFSDVSEFPAPYSTTPGKWDYSGILVRVQRQKFDHLTLPQYAIVNEDGILRCYVTPLPNMDLNPYVKKRVAFSGTRNYMREQRAFNLNVQTIVNVW